MAEPLPGLLNAMNYSGPMPVGQNTPGLLGAIMQRIMAANMRQPQAPADPEAERAMAELLGLIRPQQQAQGPQ